MDVFVLVIITVLTAVVIDKKFNNIESNSEKIAVQKLWKEGKQTITEMEKESNNNKNI